MNNAILFFYNINIREIKRINNNYYFTYLNNNYIISLYNRDLKEAQSIYYLNLELLSQGLIGYEIMLTKNNEILFSNENSVYILMKIPNIKNRIITYEDVLSFNLKTNSKYKDINKSSWSENWSGKIDFITYQFNEIRTKYKIIDNSIDYFLGMWENAISYNNDNSYIQKNVVVCHKRVKADMDLLQFLNPLEFLLDVKERDIGDYLKSYVMTKNYSVSNLESFLEGFEREDIILLISRILFPTYYFDLYEDIILDGEKEEKIDEIIQKKENILNLLKYIFKNFSHYNIPYIEWIQR